MEVMVSEKDLCGARYKVIAPMRSFFSPFNGIQPETVITLTGEFLIKVSQRARFGGSLTPTCSMKIGIKWGRNMKGIDWVTETRFKRFTVTEPESPSTPSPKKAVEEIKRLSYSTPRRRR